MVAGHARTHTPFLSGEQRSTLTPLFLLSNEQPTTVVVAAHVGDDREVRTRERVRTKEKGRERGRDAFIGSSDGAGNVVFPTTTRSSVTTMMIGDDDDD
ncbi:hypothetical protein Hanom_Chr00s004808g01725291 [Helianthus anomalus]